MTRIITIAMQKGGVGKTTTTINLAAALAEQGKRVLAIDLDPQGNLTSGVGVDKGTLEKSIYHVLIDEADISDVILQTEFENLNILRESTNLNRLF